MNDSDRTRLERVVDALTVHHVSFVVIGGWAEVLHGSPRVTRDVDVCYRRKPEDMKNILAALRSLEAKLRVPGGTVAMPIDERMLASVEQLTLDSNGLPFDLLAHVEPLGDFERVAKNAARFDINGRPVLAISLDDLITVKRHINRPKDREALFYLEAIKRLRDEEGTEASS